MSDHLIFGSFLAFSLHGLLIFGLTFSLEKPPEVSPTLEVTLALNPESESPTEADYLAQHNQKASGITDEKRELTTNQQAEFVDTKVREVKPLPPQERSRKTQQHNQLKLISAAGNKYRLAEHQEPGEQQREQEQVQYNAEIAALRALLDDQQQAYAKRPRIRTLSSVATKSAPEADYFLRWKKRIEAFGNSHYPEEARRQEIYGHLRLVVAILPDGTIKEAAILQSSGQQLLDDAALQIVRQASPFDPFPSSLRKDTDILEIIRTWRFTRGNTLTTTAE